MNKMNDNFDTIYIEMKKDVVPFTINSKFKDERRALNRRGYEVFSSSFFLIRIISQKSDKINTNVRQILRQKINKFD